MFRVEKSKTLKENMIPEGKNWRFELNLCSDEECYNMEEYFDPEDEEFVIISFENCTYRLIHGFPGDNPIGVIVDENDNIVDTCGELSMEHYEGNDMSHSMIEWYEEITENGTNYFSDFWYVQDRNNEQTHLSTDLDNIHRCNNSLTANTFDNFKYAEFLFSINLKSIDFPEDVQLQDQWKHFLKIDDIDDWELKNKNCKIFAFEEINHLLIHGGRGDNKIGIIIDENKNIVDLCCNIPQISRFKGDETSNLILNWYNRKTLGFTDYSSDIWSTE